jgi:hypothetical protein
MEFRPGQKLVVFGVGDRTEAQCEQEIDLMQSNKKSSELFC